MRSCFRTSASSTTSRRGQRLRQLCEGSFGPVDRQPLRSSSSPKGRTRPSRSRKRPTASTSALAIAARKVQAQVGVWKTQFKNRRPQLRSGSEHHRVPQPRRGRQMGHRRLGRLFADPAADALRLRLVERFGDQGQHPDRRHSVTAFNRRYCDTIATATVADARSRSCAFTAGKREGGSPTYNWASRHLARSVRSILASPPRVPARGSFSTTMSRCSAATSTSTVRRVRRSTAQRPRPTGWSTSTRAST